MQTEFIAMITLMAVVLSIVVNVVGLINKRETKASIEAHRDAKIDNILSKVEYIAIKQNAFEETIKQHAERITVVEQSNKAAWYRLDELICKVRKELKNGL